MRILIVANETIEGTRLRRAIRSQAAGAAAEVLVVAPALNSRLRHWLSDEDEARPRRTSAGTIRAPGRSHRRDRPSGRGAERGRRLLSDSAGE